MKRTASVFLLVFASIFITYAQTTDSSAVDFPAFVTPLVLVNTLTGTISQVNAFLVDSEKQLFLTNVHLTLLGNFGMLLVFGQWYIAELRSEWINWDTGLVIIRILDPPDDFPTLPQEAPLAEETPPPPVPVVVTGYEIKGAFDEEELMLKVCSVKGLIKNVFMMPNHVYAVLKVNNDQELSYNLEGSPVIGENGKVIGTLSFVQEKEYKSRAALVNPIYSIRDHLEKVQAYLEGSESIEK